MKTSIKTYTPELKEEAVKILLAQGLFLYQAAVRLSTSKTRLPIAWLQPSAGRPLQQ